jgi:hypothetical protein
MTAAIVATGIKDAARFFEQFPEIAEEAAMLAINDTVDREGMTLIKKDMRDQVNFPTGYLEGDRLKVTRRAFRGRLEAVIRGRDRATSLARFTSGQTPKNTRGQGVRVNVQRGQTQLLRNAFLVNLKNGNLGLAVRLKPGERLRNTTGAQRLADNVWLLYGPSVDQVFRGVADDRADDIAEIVSEKFYRQFGRLSRAR